MREAMLLVGFKQADSKIVERFRYVMGEPTEDYPLVREGSLLQVPSSTN